VIAAKKGRCEHCGRDDSGLLPVTADKHAEPSEHSALIGRLEFIANTPVIDEEREQVCDMAVEAIRDLERRLAELERRLLHMATSNADDWRWYQNQARQACRALGIVADTLEWDR
jgi:hypothetical protein